MKIHLLTSIFLLLVISSFSQIEKKVEIGDTTYTYTDAQFELLNASAKGDTSKIRAFLDLGTNVNCSTWEGVTPLMFAAQNGHLSSVELLIDRGAKINQKPYNQIDALLGSVIAGHVHVADTLILNGANVNTRNLDGVSPLMYAAAFNHYLLSDVLIFYGAKVNTSDNFSNYPIHFSSFYGNLEISELLLNYHAILESEDLQGFTPLMMASQNGHIQLAAYLIEQGSDVNKVNDYNCPSLSLAILNRQYEMADLLLRNGANPEHIISGKTNQYELAREVAGKEMVQVLENYGAEPTTKFRIRKLIVNFDMCWNGQDVMMGGSFGLVESVHGWEAEAGYRTRPWVRSVRYQQDDNTYYQFWEKRSLLYLGAGKRFTVTAPRPREQFGLFASANAGYTYGSFRGSDRKPDDQVIFIPKAGIYYNYKALNMRLNYEYMKIPNTNISPHRVNISVGIIFSLLKTNFKTKKEPRL